YFTGQPFSFKRKSEKKYNHLSYIDRCNSIIFVDERKSGVIISYHNIFTFVFYDLLASDCRLVELEEKVMNKRIAGILLLATILLSGCWDEEEYKDVTIVPLMGVELKSGKVVTTYAFPVFQNGSIAFS